MSPATTTARRFRSKEREKKTSGGHRRLVAGVRLPEMRASIERKSGDTLPEAAPKKKLPKGCPLARKKTRLSVITGGLRPTSELATHALRGAPQKHGWGKQKICALPRQ